MNMSTVRHIETVDEYNRLYGFTTQDPLISVVDFQQAKHWENERYTFGFYMIMLKTINCGNIKYGRTPYDYTDGSIVCIAPRQVVGVELKEGVKPTAIGLVFHPMLIQGTQLGRDIRTKFNFFSYDSNEALHVSEQEKQLFRQCLQNIQDELTHSVDNHSRNLLRMNIELLLEHLLRFYDRQFIFRKDINQNIINRFDHELHRYYEQKLHLRQGLPNVAYFANSFCLSAGYFSSLVKRETGKSVQELIMLHIIDMAKQKLLEGTLSIAEISYELGFQYPQHFTRFFKKNTGLTPREFRITA